MSLAQQALENFELVKLAISTQFFTRSSVYDFADGSSLTVNMFSRSWATPASN